VGQIGHQVALDRSRALFTQSVVVAVGTGRIGIAHDLDHVPRMCSELIRKFIERRLAIAVETGVVERELHIARLDLLCLDRPGCEFLGQRRLVVRLIGRHANLVEVRANACHFRIGRLIRGGHLLVHISLRGAARSEGARGDQQ
jgi:hypothetical protein